MKNRSLKLLTVFLILLSISLFVSFSQDSFTLQLSKGWNFISVPLVSIESVENKCGNIKVYGYDANNRIVSISDLKSLTLGKAYWIYTSYDCSITFKGTRVYTLGIAGLNQGWNAVGFGKDIQVKDLKNSCNSISSIYAFENGNWKKLSDNDYLVVGKGYWIYANEKCNFGVFAGVLSGSCSLYCTFKLNGNDFNPSSQKAKLNDKLDVSCRCTGCSAEYGGTIYNPNGGAEVELLNPNGGSARCGQDSIEGSVTLDKAGNWKVELATISSSREYTITVESQPQCQIVSVTASFNPNSINCGDSTTLSISITHKGCREDDEFILTIFKPDGSTYRQETITAGEDSLSGEKIKSVSMPISVPSDSNEASKYNGNWNFKVESRATGSSKQTTASLSVTCQQQTQCQVSNVQISATQDTSNIPDCGTDGKFNIRVSGTQQNCQFSSANVKVGNTQVGTISCTINGNNFNCEGSVNYRISQSQNGQSITFTVEINGKSQDTNPVQAQCKPSQCSGNAPDNYYSSENICYHHCTVKCENGQWKREGCQQDSDRRCQESVCTPNGWDNSRCQQQQCTFQSVTVSPNTIDCNTLRDPQSITFSLEGASNCAGKTMSVILEGGKEKTCPITPGNTCGVEFSKSDLEQAGSDGRIDFTLKVDNTKKTVSINAQNCKGCQGPQPDPYFEKNGICYYQCTVECNKNTGQWERKESTCQLATNKPCPEAKCTNEGWKCCEVKVNDVKVEYLDKVNDKIVCGPNRVKLSITYSTNDKLLCQNADIFLRIITPGGASQDEKIDLTKDTFEKEVNVNLQQNTRTKLSITIIRNLGQGRQETLYSKDIELERCTGGCIPGPEGKILSYEVKYLWSSDEKNNKIVLDRDIDPRYSEYPIKVIIYDTRRGTCTPIRYKVDVKDVEHTVGIKVLGLEQVYSELSFSAGERKEYVFRIVPGQYRAGKYDLKLMTLSEITSGLGGYSLDVIVPIIFRLGELVDCGDNSECNDGLVCLRPNPYKPKQCLYPDKFVCGDRTTLKYGSEIIYQRNDGYCCNEKEFCNGMSACIVDDEYKCKKFSISDISFKENDLCDDWCFFGLCYKSPCAKIEYKASGRLTSETPIRVYCVPSNSNKELLLQEQKLSPIIYMDVIKTIEIKDDKYEALKYCREVLVKVGDEIKARFPRTNVLESCSFKIDDDPKLLMRGTLHLFGFTNGCLDTDGFPGYIALKPANSVGSVECYKNHISSCKYYNDGSVDITYQSPSGNNDLRTGFEVEVCKNTNIRDKNPDLCSKVTYNSKKFGAVGTAFSSVAPSSQVASSLDLSNYAKDQSLLQDTRLEVKSCRGAQIGNLKISQDNKIDLASSVGIGREIKVEVCDKEYKVCQSKSYVTGEQTQIELKKGWNLCYLPFGGTRVLLEDSKDNIKHVWYLNEDNWIKYVPSKGEFNQIQGKSKTKISFEEYEEKIPPYFSAWIYSKQPLTINSIEIKDYEIDLEPNKWYLLAIRNITNISLSISVNEVNIVWYLDGKWYWFEALSQRVWETVCDVKTKKCSWVEVFDENRKNEIISKGNPCKAYFVMLSSEKVKDKVRVTFGM